MSKRGYSPLPVIPHLPDLFSLLRLIEDKKFRQEVSDWVAENEIKRKEMNDTLQDLVEAEDISDLRDSAEVYYSQARKELQDAGDKARVVLDDARVDANALTRKNAEQNQSLRNDNNKKMEELKLKEERLDARENALNSASGVMVKDRQELEKEKLETEELKEKYEKMLAKFNKAGFRIA